MLLIVNRISDGSFDNADLPSMSLEQPVSSNAGGNFLRNARFPRRVDDDQVLVLLAWKLPI